MTRATLLILFLFTLSGASGLIYEIVWIRMLSHLLGGTSYAISIVLAAFMGGLALGSRFFGPRADTTPRPLLLYARLEFGIAALGAAVYALIRIAPPAYTAIAGILPAPVLSILRALIAGILLLPPTFLMGGTLPVLSRFIVKSRDRIGRGVGILYAVNTFGAVLGSFFTGFVLIANLGLAGSTVLAVAINILVGIVVGLVDRSVACERAASAKETVRPIPTQAPSKRKKEKVKKPDDIEEIDYTVLAVIFALSGFASLGYELYWTRALQYFLGNSTYAFSAMLTTFLFGLAVGGWAGGRWADRVASPARLLGWVQIAVGGFAMLSVFLIWEWLPRIEDSQWLSRVTLPWSGYLLRRFAVAFSVMAFPTFFIGMTFPIVNRIGIRRLDGLGRGVGSLYFVNTIGSIAGALSAGFIVLPLLGSKGALIVTAVVNALLGLLVHFGNRRRTTVAPAIALALVVLMIVAGPLLKRTGMSLLSDTQQVGDTVIFEAEDHAAETRIYRKATGHLHMSVDGNYMGGNAPSMLRKEKILAHLPKLLCPEARNVLAIGLGSGITLGSMALYEELRQIKCAEIVPGVVRGARFFSADNRHVLSDPRVDIEIGDGVQYLLTTRQRFDIISSDSKLNPEYVGNSTVLSKDYYELCRDRLTDPGVMVQWLSLHLPVGEIRIIARSFAEAFPHVGVYWYDVTNIVLAGSREPLVMDLDAARSALSRGALMDELADLNLDDVYVMATLWQCGGDALREKVGEGPVNTWQRPIIEFSIGQNFRKKAREYHEDDVLRWLLSLRDMDSQQLEGPYDAAEYDRYVESAGKLLEGLSQGGGIKILENKLGILRVALASNPDDGRLQEIIQNFEREGRSIEDAYASGRLNTSGQLSEAGMLLRSQGRHREAYELFERAWNLAPDNPNIQYNRLLGLKSVDRKPEYREALEVFLESFPNDARGHSLLGREYASAGDLEKALVSFSHAVELDPENPVYHNNVAAALSRLNRYEEAARAFETVCKLQPRYENAAYYAAACYSMADMPGQSARWVRFCIDEGLQKPAQFMDDPLFTNLRASEYWDPDRGQPKL